MKKRIAALFMAGLMVVSAAGCGPNVSGEKETQKEEASTEKKNDDKGGEKVLQVVDMSDSTKARREEYNKKKTTVRWNIPFFLVTSIRQLSTLLLKQIQLLTYLLCQVV